MAHPASYPVGTRGSFPGGKAAGAWSWPLTSVCCRGQECVALYLHCPICLHGEVLKYRGNFTFYFYTLGPAARIIRGFPQLKASNKNRKMNPELRKWLSNHNGSYLLEYKHLNHKSRFPVAQSV